MSDYILRAIENFCVGRAESEESFLINAFVLAGAYHEALNAPFHSPVFLLGRKGTGKTALVKYLELKAKVSNVKCLYLKPDDIPLLEGIGEAEETSTIKRCAYEALVSAIATKIGSELRGALGKSDKKLFDKALNEGSRSYDAVQACLHGLSKFGSTVTEIDFQKLIPETEKANTKALREALKSNFQSSEKAFLLFIDDVDQVASMTNEKHINRIWGFILAIQKLTEELPNVKTIICLRTEIWAILQRDLHGQRDQVDHVRRLIRQLDPSEDQIKEIIHKRLDVIRAHLGLQKSARDEDLFFAERTVILPTSEDEQRCWDDFIAKSSRGRPRDALQFISILAEKSRKAGHTKISTQIVDAAAKQYSLERLDDLVHEYASDCSVVREIVQSFAKVQFVITSDDLRAHLISLPSQFGITIRGVTIHREKIADIFCLWKFIHEIGLVNPKIPDRREDRNFRHILYDENSEFVSEANWNEMQKTVWELHPAYRSHLIALRANEKARTGINLLSFLNPRSKR